MRQIIQYPRQHAPQAVVVPDPEPGPGMVLIRNRASLISSGTERSSVRLARASLVEKARRRPDLVRQVMRNVTTEGITRTWQKVRHRLADPLAPGYSCAGVVTGVADESCGFRVGERVAAAGQGLASHAEYVNVPRNLVCRLPEPVEFVEGAFVAVGAVALQGVRTAQPQIGETVAVIGLGLVGQLTAQILTANGCRVVGIDPSSSRRGLARETTGATVADPEDAAPRVMDVTGERGADAVIICAATDSRDLLEAAAQLARDRAVIVAVGAFPLDVPRTAFYKKELQLRLSRSYGPGRYDSSYERRGEDYPPAYVRWTENRNMEGFLDLLAQRRIDVRPLITHRFDIDRATQAYETVENNAEAVAVVFEYAKSADRTPVVYRPPSGKRSVRKGRLGVGFWGAGRFAGGVLMPIFAAHPRSHLVGVVSQSPLSAHKAMRQRELKYATCRKEELLSDPAVDIVVIATPHSLHAVQATEALEAGKIVFLEKPMAITREQLRSLADTVAEVGGRLQVGFNRRYSPAVQRIRAALETTRGPKTIVYRVAAGPCPTEGWLADPAEGGRLIGETAHFADTIQYLSGSWPCEVTARRLGPSTSDGVMMVITFVDGSVGTIIYSADAHPRTPKERVEVFAGGMTAIIDDYVRWEVFLNGRHFVHKSKQDKGHRAQVDALFNSVTSEGLAAGDLAAAISATEMTFAAIDSLRDGTPVAMQPWF